MSVFDYVPEPLLLLVIGIASLLFGFVLHATRDRGDEPVEEEVSQAHVEISHAVTGSTRID